MESRKREWEDLINQPIEPPEQWGDSFVKAENRYKKEQRKRLSRAISSTATVILLFILSVNLFPSFAYACGRIPLLKDLAKAVALSPSLSAAVDNQFVQVMEQEAQDQGITMKIHYLIVDRSQLNIYYTLDFPAGEKPDDENELMLEVDFQDPADKVPELSYGVGLIQLNELNELQAQFIQDAIPDQIQLTCRLYRNKYRTKLQNNEETTSEERHYDHFFKETKVDSKLLATFTHDLQFDPYFTTKGEIKEINKTIIAQGQEFTVEKLIIYPTNAEFQISYNPSNTKEIRGMDFYLKNEKGEVFRSVTNGVSGVVGDNGKNITHIYIESPFFSQSKKLTLFIDRIIYLDKEHPKAWIDLKKQKANHLPPGIRLKEVANLGKKHVLVFDKEDKNSYHDVFRSYSHDKDEEFRYFGSQSSASWEEGRTEIAYPLKDYPYDQVYLEIGYSEIWKSESPLKVLIK